MIKVHLCQRDLMQIDADRCCILVKVLLCQEMLVIKNLPYLEMLSRVIKVLLCLEILQIDQGSLVS